LINNARDSTEESEIRQCELCGMETTNWLERKSSHQIDADSTIVVCKKCDYLLDQNENKSEITDLNKKKSYKNFRFEINWINWFVPFVFSYALISAIFIFFIQEIYLPLIFTFIIFVLFFVIWRFSKRSKNEASKVNEK